MQEAARGHFPRLEPGLSIPPVCRDFPAALANWGLVFVLVLPKGAPLPLLASVRACDLLSMPHLINTATGGCLFEMEILTYMLQSKHRDGVCWHRLPNTGFAFLKNCEGHLFPEFLTHARCPFCT